MVPVWYPFSFQVTSTVWQGRELLAWTDLDADELVGVEESEREIYGGRGAGTGEIEKGIYRSEEKCCGECLQGILGFPGHKF